MASLTITAPNEHVPRIVAAVEDVMPRAPLETDADLVRRFLVTILRQRVLDHEGQQATNAMNVDEVASLLP